MHKYNLQSCYCLRGLLDSCNLVSSGRHLSRPSQIFLEAGQQPLVSSADLPIIIIIITIIVRCEGGQSNTQDTAQKCMVEARPNGRPFWEQMCAGMGGNEANAQVATVWHDTNFVKQGANKTTWTLFSVGKLTF